MTEQIQENKAEQTVEKQTVIIKPPVQDNNPLGIAGFILSILAILLGCVPVLGWILWILGLVFSIIGVTKEPKGFAIAGLIISFIGLILLIVFVAGLVGLSALASVGH